MPQDIRDMEVNTAAGNWRISVIVVHRSPRSDPAKKEVLFLILGVAAGSVGKWLILRDLNAPRVD